METIKGGEDMEKRTAWIIFFFMILAFVQLAFTVSGLMELRSLKPFFAQDDELSRQTLRGLDGVHVVIEFVNPEIVGDGLTQDRLQADVELQLQEAGITVLSEAENQTTPGRPLMYMNVNILKYKYIPAYIYNIRLELVQDVYLVRSSNVKIGGVTWSINTAGIVPKLNDIKTSMENLVDYFAKAYLSANPQ
jgi:hypothetical protein